MSRVQAGTTPQMPKRKVVPVVLILDPCCQAVAAPYCQAVLKALHDLHPSTQLLVTSLVPSPHTLSTQPFVPQAVFLPTVAAALRRPLRPGSSLWRSSAGVLRCIKTARKLLEVPIAGAEPDSSKSQLPRYVVVITATDIENGDGDEIWLEDAAEPAEDWQTMAKTFTRPPHQTTLFSLISLGHTPNLEAFWKEASGRFPPHLVYNSLTATPSLPFSFPLFAPTHACFLIGFYNSRTAASGSSGSATPQGSGQPSQASKRNASSDVAASSKKAKTAGQTPRSEAGGITPAQSTPAGQSPQKDAHTKPMPPPHTRTASGTVQTVNRTASPALPGMALTNDNLQQFITEMKASAARNGLPPPSNQEIQAAITHFAGRAQQPPGASPFLTGSGAAFPSPSMSTPQLQQVQQMLQSSPGHAPQRTSSPAPPTMPYRIDQCSPEQIAQLPPLAQDVRIQVENHMNGLRSKLSSGEMTQDEAAMMLKKLHSAADQHRLDTWHRMRNQTQGLGLNVGQPQQAQPFPTPPQTQQQLPQQQQRPSNSVQPGQPKPSSIDETAGNRSDYLVLCQATSLHEHTARELNDIKLPQDLRVSNLVPIKTTTLQELTTKHNLPVMSVQAIANDLLPKEIRDRIAQNGLPENTSMYSKLAQTLETRGLCGIVRLPQPGTGIVLACMGGQKHIIGLVFVKTPLPEAWLQGVPMPTPPAAPPLQSSPMLQAQQAAFQQQLQLLQQQAHQQAMNSGSMFATGVPPAQNNYQNFMPPQQSSTDVSQQQQQQPQPQQQSQQYGTQYPFSSQQQADLAELQRMLGQS